MSLSLRTGHLRTGEAVIATKPRGTVGTSTTVLSGATPRARGRARRRAVGILVSTPLVYIRTLPDACGALASVTGAYTGRQGIQTRNP